MTVRMAARYGHFALEGLRLTGSAGPRFGREIQEGSPVFPPGMGVSESGRAN